MLLAAGLAIASKFIFRVRGKHFFNPANFGIIAALTLTKDAWVSPGQWGTDWWYLALFLATGGLILKKIGRWETSLVFLGVYASLEAIRNVWLGWDSEVLLHHLSSGSLLVFALFMLTDPRSIPNAIKGRIIWAISIAFLTFILQYTLYLQTAMFWALFCLSPLTILLDFQYFFPRFNWQKSNALSPQLNT
jgi:Na+-transporting NADH:ubiquinone oxidoreductase subunit NqrB